MKTVIGVKFRGMGKSYWFDPLEWDFTVGDRVVVETARSVECGTVSQANRQVSDEEVSFPLKPVERPATREDLAKVAGFESKERDAFNICRRKIEAHKLEMKLVDVEYAFDGSKIIFYFTADGRVDFRELVKDLASMFKNRIELRQIGVRDESRMLGGIGMCGREFCCRGFLFDFQPVSIKMAKEQGMSLNPVKISGACGRLMCCLKYEQEAYEVLGKATPPPGSLVRTADGEGIVTDSSLLTGNLKVRLSREPDAAPRTYKREDVEILRRSRGKGGAKSGGDQS